MVLAVNNENKNQLVVTIYFEGALNGQEEIMHHEKNFPVQNLICLNILKLNWKYLGAL